MSESYFPLGIAEGPAFLGRHEEIRRLSANIEQGRHTLLLSPRRYGKTSLARHVIYGMNDIFCEIDLFLAIDEYAVETRLTRGIESIIQKLSHKKEKWLQLLLDFFKKSDQTWTIGFKGAQLQLKPNHHSDVPGNILDLFNALETMLSKQQKKAVVFIDEFQEITKIKTGKAIEGAIRHFAQASKQVVFIFSGSSRHLLLDMFNNRSRPLYKLCDWITLSRLDAKLYQSYLNKIAQKTLGSPLTEAVFDEIVTLSQCHPEGIYALCGQLWLLENNKKSFEKQDVQAAWKKHISEHIKQTRTMLSANSTGQMKVLILIAQGVTQQLTGKDAQKKLDLTSPSIVKALQTLEAEDLIERNSEGAYIIIDPVVKSSLLELYADYFELC
ncbi:MAG: ATP-binding protein [Gammaproteobacteria bacterium]